MSIARACALALAAAALAAGCGGDDSKSNEDLAGDVAKEYVSTNANSEEEKCAETLASGVDPKLCDDLGPLAARVNPEVEEAKVSGQTATVTVTGAGNNTLLDISLVRQDGEWRVQRWRGRTR